MNLIDKYIAEVGKHLPRKQRADIEAEIRSTLEDMLEERKQANGQISEVEIIELLKEYAAQLGALNESFFTYSFYGRDTSGAKVVSAVAV